MVNGKRPVIYGDGQPVRDLIYIDDVVEAIAILAETCNEPTMDVGYGQSFSFNDIVDITNSILFDTDTSKFIEPKYIKAPYGYVQETVADVDKLREYYTPQTTPYTGIKNVIIELTKAG